MMADIPEWFTKKVTRVLHDQGFEMTPAEVEEQRKAAYATLRQELKNRGIEPPEGELEFLQWLREMRA